MARFVLEHLNSNHRYDHPEIKADDCVAIDPRFQSQGLGTLLLEACIEKANAENLPVYLKAMPAPYSLYLRHDFVVLDHADIDLNEWGRKFCGYGIHRSYSMLREPDST